MPVLPQGLLTILDTPSPIMVGISTRNYDVNLDHDDIDLIENKTWVFLDEEGNNMINWGQFD